MLETISCASMVTVVPVKVVMNVPVHDSECCASQCVEGLPEFLALRYDELSGRLECDGYLLVNGVANRPAAVCCSAAAFRPGLRDSRDLWSISCDKC